jgi:hypothetical protein
MGFLMSTRPCGCYTESQNIVFNRDGSFTALPGTATLLVDHCAAHSGLPFTDAELERFQETLRQGTAQAPHQGFTVGIIDANGNPRPNPDAMDYDAWIKKYFGDDLDAARRAVEGEVGRRGLPLEIEVSLCTAKPSCDFPDEECPVCKAGNCPGVKCWRCGGKR